MKNVISLVLVIGETIINDSSKMKTFAKILPYVCGLVLNRSEQLSFSLTTKPLHRVSYISFPVPVFNEVNPKRRSSITCLETSRHCPKTDILGLADFVKADVKNRNIITANRNFKRS